MHDAGHLQEILILLAAAVSVVASFKLLRLSPVLGYLVAGAVIGPHGLGMIQEIEDTSAIAEFGVMFLLFLIGIELSFTRLRAMRSQVLGMGSAQVIITGGIIGLTAWLMGATPEMVIIIGGGLALSSTAIVLQVLHESGERTSRVGRLAFAILLLQDLAVVPLLVLVPLLAATDTSIPAALADAGLKAFVVLVLIFLIGRRLLRPLFRLIASFGTAELFTATTLLVVFGTSWFTYTAGLSAALGAFIAGLLVAETEYQHQIAADVTPYKGLFLGLFFMTIGMSVDVNFLLQNIGLILALALLLMAAKATILYALLRAANYGRGTSFHTGLLMSQGGEFGFVLFALAAQDNLLSPPVAQILLVMTTVSMALTPTAEAIGKRLRQRVGHTPGSLPDLSSAARDLENHVIIAGFGRMGQTVAKMLTTENLSYIALDTDPKNIEKGRARNKPVYFGDATRLDVLQAVRIEHAHSAIITMKGKEMISRTIRALRRAYPELPIIVSAKDMDHAAELQELGATVAVPEVLESSLQLGAALLHTMGAPGDRISRVLDICRAQHYAYLAPEAAAESEESEQTQAAAS